MSSTPETVCPKCGATEIKNYAWLRPLGVLVCFGNAVVQLGLGIVFFQTLNIWSQVGHSIVSVALGIGFWILSTRIQHLRCTKCRHFW